MWLHHDSTGSINSSNGGSMSYPTHRSEYSSVPSIYQQPQLSVHHTPTSSSAGLAQYDSSSPYQQQSDFSMPQYHTQQPQFQQHQYQQPIYDFGQTSAPLQTNQYQLPQTTHGRPSVQFASWSGYSGHGGHPDTLDDENAVDPTSNPWRINET
jgi:hypothetical protein